MRKILIIAILILNGLLLFSQEKNYKFIMYTAMELKNPHVKQYHNSIYMRPMLGGSLSKFKVDKKLLHRYRDDVFLLGDSVITLKLREDDLKRVLGFRFNARIDSVSSNRHNYYCYNKEFGRCLIYVDFEKNQVQLRLKYIPNYDLYQFIYVFLTQPENIE
jgi:hypothetical protein